MLKYFEIKIEIITKNVKILKNNMIHVKTLKEINRQKSQHIQINVKD